MKLARLRSFLPRGVLLVLVGILAAVSHMAGGRAIGTYLALVVFVVLVLFFQCYVTRHHFPHLSSLLPYI
jgi:hypothetical protein